VAPSDELRKSEGISIQLTIIKAANFYWKDTTGESFWDLPGTAWIRLSTGKLCIDVGSGYESCAQSVGPPHFELPEVKLTEYDLGDKLLSTLELNEFYSLVAQRYAHYLRSSPSISGTIMLPSIYNPCCQWDCAHLKLNDLHAIPTTKHLTVDDLYIGSWYNVYTSDLPQEVLSTGWTRCAYGCFAPSFSNDCSVELIIQIVPIEP
jgi:hypothetical protein